MTTPEHEARLHFDKQRSRGITLNFLECMAKEVIRLCNAEWQREDGRLRAEAAQRPIKRYDVRGKLVDQDDKVDGTVEE